MDRRLALHEELCDILGSGNAYFQPPENITLKYPCIIYKLHDVYIAHADNLSYFHKKKYMLTIISRDPESDLPEEVIKRFQGCSFSNGYTADGLNHWVFTIYY